MIITNGSGRTSLHWIKLNPNVNQMRRSIREEEDQPRSRGWGQQVLDDAMRKVLFSLLLTAIFVIPVTAESASGVEVITVNRTEVQTSSPRVSRNGDIRTAASGSESGNNFAATQLPATTEHRLLPERRTKALIASYTSRSPPGSIDRGSRNASPGQSSLCPDWSHRTSEPNQSGTRMDHKEGEQSGGTTHESGGAEDSVQTGCSCYEFEEGVFIECPNTDLQSVIEFLAAAKATLRDQSIKSFSIYNLTDSVRELPARTFSNSSQIEKLRISDTLIESVSDEAFTGIASSLKTLAISSSKLKSVPQKPLSLMKSLESLDLDSNQIQEIGSYSFYGLSLTSLNLQSNRISSLLEYSFGGLEYTLQELILIQNRLESVPIAALRRLKNMRSLKLNENFISQIPVEEYTTFSKLQNLDLRSNRIQHLDEKSFKSTPKLVSLFLSENKLTRIEDKVFSHLADLESLDLSKNSLRVLNGAVFASLNKLRSIDLSYNQLHFVETATFHGLPNLQELFLTKNSLVKLLNGTFYNSTQIRTLFLEDNYIETIESGVFASLPHLFQLHLSINQISSLDAQIFRSNQQLRSLSLDNNQIETMRPGLLDNLHQLRDLRLQKNVIKKISRYNFNHLTLLQELHLQHNLINSIEVDSFRNLTDMEYLNLQGNQIDSMIHRIFSTESGGLKQLTLSQNSINRLNEKAFEGQTRLEILSLDHNRLTKITRSMFNNMTSIEKLYLDHNEIEWIESLAFSSLKNLMELNLANNRISRLEGKTFQGIASLKSLDLSCNPISVIESGTFTPLTTAIVLLKCVQTKAGTEASSSQMFISFQNISLTTIIIVASSVTSALFTSLIVIVVVIQWRKKPVKVEQHHEEEVEEGEEERIHFTEIPDEYLTYRHFPFSSTENVFP